MIMSSNSAHQNRLASETSPYLLQHADNPVDWYPWGEAAFDLARKSNKPILLSVGYSACHWCHVMAHESFENEQTGNLMNKLFVNVKVDREERPDVDKLYQSAHQLLTQRAGGWPLTMFINPDDQRPFFGGTYFPDEARHGMPPFRDLLTRVAEYYANSREEITAQGTELLQVLSRIEPQATAPDVVLNESALNDARQKISATFDREFGGFGNAPKFPHPTTLDRLLRDWRASANSPEPDVDALFMVSLTLTRMAEGGIFDHLGGGFCRYTVDRFWQIPHFEKMLYDNGPLLALYAQLHIATGDPTYAAVANETAAWILDDMLAPNGGFYSTRDADSEGEEGRYYVWTPDQAKALLEPVEFELFAKRYGLDVDANFEGNWHLSVRRPLDEIASEADEGLETVERRINVSRQKLLKRRQDRIAPARDDKQLTSWNALAIRGFAIAGRALENSDYVDAAVGSIAFIDKNLMHNDRLFVSFKDEQYKFPAYLDDHAFLLDALIETLQARWNSESLHLAIKIADLLIDHFFDDKDGGFFFTANDHEQLMHRTKSYADDATPSGNGIAVLAMQRLGFLLGEQRYLQVAETTLKNAWSAMAEYPQAHVSLLSALEEYIAHPEIIILRGEPAEIARWQVSAAKIYAPRRLLFAIPENAAELPGALAQRRAVANKTIAYRCVGPTCSLPMDSWEALATSMQD